MVDREDTAASAGIDPKAENAELDDHRMSRRGLLRKAPVAAVAALGATAILERPAAASDGSAILAGNITTAEHATQVKFDGTSSPGVVLLGNDTGFDATAAAYPAAVAGWAGTTVANGVYGYTENGAGNAVVGVNVGSGSGTGILGTSGSGTAISGSTGSTAASATAIIGTITSTSPGGFSSAVRGKNNGTGGLGIGVWGSQAGFGWGMYATSASGIGLNATGGSGTGVNASGATGVSASGSGLGGIFSGGQAPISLSPAGAPGAPTTGAHGVGDVWVDSLGTQWTCTGAGTPGTFAPVQTGGLNQAVFTAVSTQQYSLANSNGTTWMDIDATLLKSTVTPGYNCQAIISGNADLWTATAGFNQDIGIFISGGAYGAGQIVAWKESGGFAGTFSPNAAFVQTVQPLAAGTTYTIKLQWKTNKPGTSAIFIGAGGGPFSPTRLTTLLMVSS